MLQKLQSFTTIRSIISNIEKASTRYDNDHYTKIIMKQTAAQKRLIENCINGSRVHSIQLQGTSWGGSCCRMMCLTIHKVTSIESSRIMLQVPVRTASFSFLFISDFFWFIDDISCCRSAECTRTARSHPQHTQSSLVMLEHTLLPLQPLQYQTVIIPSQSFQRALPFIHAHPICLSSIEDSKRCISAFLSICCPQHFTSGMILCSHENECQMR